MNDTPDSLPIESGSDRLNVPVFNCVVYVQRTDDGVSARVVNLEGLEFSAANERAALSQVIPAFKQRLSELMQTGDAIPWIEPLPAMQPNEEQRLIPVHL